MRNWENDLTKLLGVKYPIIQAPMFGVSTPEMVAAAARANAIGSLALGDMPAEKCVELIDKTKKLTAGRPFIANIFVNSIPQLSEEQKLQYNEARAFIQRFAEENGLSVNLSTLDDIVLTDYKEQIEVLIAQQCRLVSFTFDNLDGQSIQRLKEHGTVLIGTCTSVAEAKILEQSGIDILCVQGIEAGGHRGTFLDDHIPQIGGIALLSQVYEQSKLPIIYAGGIYNARTFMAAYTMGAHGVQVGSLLLGAEESNLQQFEKERLQHVEEEDIILTRSFSGRYARGIRNKFIDTVENSGYVLPYPYQNKLTNALRSIAKSNQNADFVSIWVGQSIHSYCERSATDILGKLIAEINELG